MRLEMKTLQTIIENSGINHSLSPSIFPNKHPFISDLIKSLKNLSVGYMYYSDTDSVTITNDLPSSRYEPLLNVFIAPSKDALIFMFVLDADSEDYDYEFVMNIHELIDEILPNDTPFEIMGI